MVFDGKRGNYYLFWEAEKTVDGDDLKIVSVISLNYFDCVIICCTIADDKDREGFIIIIKFIMYNILHLLHTLYIYLCSSFWF